MFSRNLLLIQSLIQLSLAQQQYFCSNENTAESAPMEDTYQSSLLCSEHCLKEHYAYAIIQQFVCWCSNTSPGTTVDAGKCDTACPGYGLQNCGGVNNGAFGYFYLGGDSGSAKPLDLYSQSEVSRIVPTVESSTSETPSSSGFSSTSEAQTSSYSERFSSSSSSIESSSSYETSTKQNTLSSQHQTIILKYSSSSTSLSIPPSPSSSSFYSSSSSSSYSSSYSSSSSSSTVASTSASSSSITNSERIPYHSPVTTTNIRLTTSIVYSIKTLTQTYSHYKNTTSHTTSTVSPQATIQYITTEIVSTQYTQEPITTVDPRFSNKRSNTDSFWHSSGKVAGIFIGVGVFLVAAVFLLVFFYYKNRARDDEDGAEEDIYVYGDSKDGERKANGGGGGGNSDGVVQDGYYRRNVYSNGILFSPDTQSLQPSLSDDGMGEYVLVDQRLDPGQMLTELRQTSSHVSLADDVDYTRRVLSVVNG